MASKAKKSPFGPGLMKFLRELKAHNNRDWFLANKDRYEEHVREPAREFVRLMAPKLARISPHLVASDKKVGGSLMRINRDVRFSADKSPYKTNVGISFRHEEGKDVHAPGYYVHLEPGSLFLGAGMWHPEKNALAGMRAAIAADGRAWKRVRDGKAFRAEWKLEGDSLKRAPKGYDPEHPLIVDLRRKDHIAVAKLAAKDVTRPDLVDHLTKLFRAAKPYMAFQAKALRLPF